MAHLTEYRTEYRWTDKNADEPERTEAGEWIHTVDPDEIDLEEGLTVVDLAHNILRDAGIYEASNYPEWHPHTWYIADYTDPYTGVIEETTYHPYGLTEDESRELYRRIVGR